MSACIPMRAALCLSALLLLPMASAKPSAAAQPSTVVILCEGLHATDLHDARLASLRALAVRGAVGLITMPPRVAASPETAILSLAIGGPATGRPEDREAYRSDERVEGALPHVVLARRTGHRPVTNVSAHIIHIGIASLQRRRYADRVVSARSDPGQSALRITAELPDDLDLGDARRLAALFAIDKKGFAPKPGTEGAEIIVTSAGDDMLAVDRRVRRAADAGQRIWVIAYRPSQPIAGPYLTRPTLTVLGGPGIPSGLITSRTTRTPGLISYVDVAPTLRAWIGNPTDPGSAGHPIAATSERRHLALLAKLDRTMAMNEAGLVPVLLSSGIFAGIVMLLALTALRFVPVLIPGAKALSCASMGIPVAFMVTGPVAWMATTPPNPWTIGCVMAVLAVSLGIGFRLWPGLRRVETGPGMLCAAMAIIAGAILTDAWTGQNLMKSSILSAAGTAGARFYGIGNEYMGFLVATASGLALMGRLPRPATVALMLVVIASLGLGSVGANAGGVITAVATFTVMLATMDGRSFRRHWAPLGIALGVIAAVLFSLLDRLIEGPDSSHLGAIAMGTEQAGVRVLTSLLARKLAMSLGAATSPHGMFALTAGVAIVGGVAWLMHCDIARVAARYPGWWEWRRPAAVGAFTALIFNDTGIVPMLIIFGAFVYSGLVLRLHMPADTSPRKDAAPAERL